MRKSHWIFMVVLLGVVALAAGLAAYAFVRVQETETVARMEPENAETSVASEPSGTADAVQDIQPETTVDVSSEQQAEADTDTADGTSETAESSAEQNDNTVTITISAAGDVSLGNYVGQDYSWSFNEMYAQVDTVGYFFQNVSELFTADDMTIVNLECVLTTSEEPAPDRTYNIKGDPSYADILTAGGVEAVSMANNHKNDFGAQGISDTTAALDEAGVVYAYDSNVGIYETKGIRIGFVSVNETSMGAGVEQLLKDGIGKLQEEGVDLILACCHWGTEGENYPEEYQQSLGHKCIDWGADLVIGHHPHVLQGVEEYQGKYIIYSLANFCFGANRNPTDKDTMIIQQTFTFTDGVKQDATELRMIPCSVSSVSTRNDYCPTPQTGDEAQRIIDRVNEYSRDLGVEFDGNGYAIRN